MIETCNKKILEAKVKANSIEKDDFKKACKEWRVAQVWHTEHSTCDCTHSPITAVHEIYNKLTDKRLHVGSVCVDWFTPHNAKVVSLDSNATTSLKEVRVNFSRTASITLLKECVRKPWRVFTQKQYDEYVARLYKNEGAKRKLSAADAEFRIIQNSLIVLGFCRTRPRCECNKWLAMRPDYDEDVEEFFFRCPGNAKGEYCSHEFLVEPPEEDETYAPDAEEDDEDEEQESSDESVEVVRKRKKRAATQRTKRKPKAVESDEESEAEFTE